MFSPQPTLVYQSFGVEGCIIVLEAKDARNFLMAPNRDLLAIHKYNTEYDQHCVACFIGVQEDISKSNGTWTKRT